MKYWDVSCNFPMKTNPFIYAFNGKSKHTGYMGVSINGGSPKMDGLVHGKSQSQMDDN